MSLVLLILTAIWFFLPAYMANMMPVFAAKMRFLDFLGKPVDFGLTLRGKPLLGKNKTLRGILTGVLAGILVAYLQKSVSQQGFFASISIVDLSAVSPLLWGFLLGFGALFGDMVKSLIKRQVGIGPGKMFFPFDQLDYTIFGLLFAAVVIIPKMELILVILVINTLLHILSNIIGYLIGVKDVWY